MPIYEYRCEACGHEEEFLQKISAEPLTDCPACGKPELKRKISAAAFRLKGGGWYETDFKNSNQKNLAGERDAKGGDSGGKSDSGSTDKSGGDKAAATKTAEKPAAAKPAGKPTAKPSSSGSASGGS